MSTKSTIVHGKDFHLYTDGYDRDNIFLNLPSSAVELEDIDEVSIKIPLAVWEYIRQQTCVDFTWVGKTDEQILQYVTDEVDNRLSIEIKNAIQRFSGMLVYGLTDDPRDSQIRKGVAYYHACRSRQTEIQNELNDYLKK